MSRRPHDDLIVHFDEKWKQHVGKSSACLDWTKTKGMERRNLSATDWADDGLKNGLKDSYRSHQSVVFVAGREKLLQRYFIICIHIHFLKIARRAIKEKEKHWAAAAYIKFRGQKTENLSEGKGKQTTEVNERGWGGLKISSFQVYLEHILDFRLDLALLLAFLYLSHQLIDRRHHFCHLVFRYKSITVDII